MKKISILSVLLLFSAALFAQQKQKIAEADQIWCALIGPDTQATGEVKGESQYYQNQLAKTIAAFLGLDYKGENKIGDVVAPMLKAK